MTVNRDNWIKFLFKIGLTNKEIISFLDEVYDFNISHRQLKRITKKFGLYRRKNFSDILDVSVFIQRQLEGSGQYHGYRWMHQKCIQAGFVIQKEYVRILLGVLDSQGVSLRAKRNFNRRQYVANGPNFNWHLDSYDKLKPYGICINGCIDGFSRYIVWMNVGKSNNDPFVVASYYCRAVLDVGGVPVTLRGDMGTENSLVAELQTVLGSGNAIFLYGTSQHNQRIESWWCILRKEKIQFWISLFEDLKAGGYFSGDFFDKALIQFCFMRLIRIELRQMVMEWNTHRLRKNLWRRIENGRPISLYHLPHSYGVQDYLYFINQQDKDICRDLIRFNDETPCDEDIFNICNEYTEEMGLPIPDSPFQAVNIYQTLRQRIRMDLHLPA